MRYLDIEEIISLLRNNKLEITVCDVTEPYWKRPFEYRSNNRELDMDEISYIVKGQIYGEINGGQVEISPGGLFWMRAFTPHSLVWPEELIYFTLRFKLNSPDGVVSIKLPFKVCDSIQHLEVYFRKIVYILREGLDRKFNTDRLKALFLLLFSYIETTNESESHYLPIREFSEIEKQMIFSYCQSQSFVNISSDTLAYELNMSRDYFSRIFKATFKKSAREWLHEEKLHFAARRLIDSDISIQDLSELLGYTDIYVFSRQFKRVMGLSPRHYRNENKMITRTARPPLPPED